MDGTSRLSDSDSETEIGLIFTRDPSTSKEKPKEREYIQLQPENGGHKNVVSVGHGPTCKLFHYQWLTLNIIFLPKNTKIYH